MAALLTRRAWLGRHIDDAHISGVRRVSTRSAAGIGASVHRCEDRKREAFRVGFARICAIGRKLGPSRGPVAGICIPPCPAAAIMLNDNAYPEAGT